MKINKKEFEKLPVLQKIRIHSYIANVKQAPMGSIICSFVSIMFSLNNLLSFRLAWAFLFMLISIVFLVHGYRSADEIWSTLKQHYPKVVTE